MNVKLSHSDVLNNLVADDQNDDYYYQLVQHLPAAIYTCDADGYIKFYNNAAVQLWGREPEIGKDLWCGSWKIYTTDGRLIPLSECPMAIALKEKRPVTGVSIIVERPDGEKRHILPHPEPIFNAGGTFIGARNMLVDVTEHKQIREANEKLKFYNEQLDQFAYAASHDLQEPLRKIKTFASLISIKNQERLDETGKKYLAKLKDAANRMTNLVSDLLAYSRSLNIDEQLVPVDLNEMIENIKSDLEIMLLETDAKIESEPLPTIKAVPSQINRLFYNLINNSLKFVKKGNIPVINITSTVNNSFIEIIVKDNGIGFENIYAETIFTLFQRLHDKKSYQGNGIGLSMCKKIVESYKGEIFATSELNKGAEFHIKLPVSLLIENPHP